MAPEISEGTKVTLDLKTIGLIIGGVISLATMYFALKAEIEVAKELPNQLLVEQSTILKIS
jgi:hypothetical protein